MSIFKAYDVRGTYPTEIDEKIAGKIAGHFARMRQGELKENRQLNLAAGRDMRLSSPALSIAVQTALADYGVRVVDIGLVSTPAFYFAVAKLGLDGGIMVSASHNPAGYNGLKLVRERALPFGVGMGMEELADAVATGEKIAPSGFTGMIEKRENINQEYVAFEAAGADLKKIKNFKIVWDSANAMGATYLAELMKLLPQVEWLPMNFDLDGRFPAHEPDPLKEENIRALCREVESAKADLGVATDGDGDRIFFVDNIGRVVEPGIVRGILARLFLRDNPGAVICYDVRPGKITRDMIEENGGQPSLTRVGHSLIKAQMVKEGAVFGGESSGHFFVKFPHGVYEAPVLVLLKILVELSESGLSFADYIKPLQKYWHSGEINFKVADKAKVFDKLRSQYADGEINELDGLSITYPDVWFNVRASNTESVVRLNVEGREPGVIARMVAEVGEIIKS